MYEYNGSSITEANIKEYADVNNMTYDDAFSQLTNAGMVQSKANDIGALRPLTIEELFELPSYLGGATTTEKLALTGAGITEAISGFFGYGDALVFSTDLKLREQQEGRDYTDQERLDLFKQYEKTGLTGYLNEATDYLNQYLAREDGTVTAQLLKFAETKDIKDVEKAAEKTVDGMIESIPSLIAARFGPYGLAVLGVSVAGNKFKQEIYEDAGRDTGLLLANAAGSGAIEAGFEAVTYGLMKRAGLIKNKYGTETAKRYFTESIGQFGKRLGVDFLTEGASEAATEATNIAFDALTLGDEVEMKDAAQRIGDAFIIGGAVGPTITSVGKVNDIVNPKAKERAYNALMSTPDQLALTAIAQEADKVGSSADKSDPISVQKADQRLSQLNAYANRIKGENTLIIDEMTEQELSDYVEKVDRQTELKKEYRKTQNQQSKNQIEQEYNQIDNEIKEFRKTIIDRLGDKYTQNVVELANDIDAEVEIYNEDNGGVEAAQKRYEELTGRKDDIRDADGYYDPTSGVFIINEITAKEKKAVSVANHEFLHRIIGDSYSKLTKEQKINLNKGFFKILSKDQKDAVLTRFKENNIEGDAIFESEEMFTYFSDAIDKKAAKFNESTFNRIGNIFEELLRLRGKRSEFENGRQVYNFLKNYHKSIEKQKLSKRVKEFAKVDAPTGIPEVTVDQVVRESRTYQKTDRDNRIDKLGEQYTKEEYGSAKDNKPGKGEDVYFELYASGDLEAMVRGNITEDIKRTPGFLEEDFVNETIVQLKRHVENFDINKKKTEQGFGLSGWIRGQINNKIYDVLKEGVVTEEKFTSDIQESTEAQAVAAEQQDIERLEEQNLTAEALLEEQRKAEKQAEEGVEEGVEYSTTRRALTVKGEQGIPESIVNKVRDAVVKTMATEKTTPDSDKFIAKIKKSFLTELKKPIQDMMGKKGDFDVFLRENKEAIVAALPTSTLVQIERNVKPEDRIFTVEIKKNLSPTEVDDAVANDQLPKNVNRNSGPSLYEKRMPTTKEFVDFYNPPAQVFSEKLGTMVRSGLKGTRKDTLAEQLGIELAFDATMEVVQSPEVAERRSLATGIEFAQAQASELAKAINRGVDIRFSHTVDGKKRIEKLTASMVKEVGNVINKYHRDNSYIVISDDGSFTTKERLAPYFRTRAFSKKDTSIIAEVAYKLYQSQPYGYIKNNATRDKVIVDIIKKKRKGVRDSKLLQANRIYEQLFINTIGSNMKKINNQAYVNRFIEEGGKGDVYVTLGDNTVGIEIKMDSAFGVSKTAYVDLENGKFIFKYIKDSDTESGKESEKLLANAMSESMADLNEILKGQDLDITSENIETDKNGNTRIVLNEAQFQLIQNSKLKSLVMSGSFVDANYIMQAYGDKSLPEGFITVGGKVYLMETGNKKTDKISRQIAASMPKGINIPIFENKDNARFAFEMHMKTTKRSDGKYNVSFRAMPAIKGKYLVESKVNLLEDKTAKQFTEAINKVLSDKKLRLSKTKGISILDFDDTLATSKSLIKFTKPDGSKGTLTPEQYASTYEDLLDLGYKFDFSEFSKVVDGKPAPLLNKAKKLASKFGTKDMFVLTARPADSAPAIQKFLKENGLDIPLKNITGLGNSTAEAKALWIADKAAEGYNDFYFADDALKNVQAVQNMLDQFDVKSKVQQAKVKFSQTNIDERLNKMLETNKGVPAEEIFEKARAQQLGKNKGKYEFFISAGADDFAGLMTRLAGKGKQGDADMQFFKETLFDPYNRAYRQINEYNYNMLNDYSELIKDNPEIKKQLTRKFGDTDFTTQQAIRIYLWDQAGYDIPGMSEAEVEIISTEISRDADLRYFANLLSRIPKTEYPKPKDHWVVENIKADLYNSSEANRVEFLQEWQENADALFSDKNLNKLEATMGSSYVSALKDSLFRMKTGKNRPTGPDGEVNKWLNWVNNSVGAIMFFNARSAVLQTISTVNYLDFENNNIFKAAKAFANQKQYWSDFTYLFNSPTLKQRRAGVQTDVSASDIANAVRDKRNPAGAALAYLLRIGFTPTQLADSFAISAGGATYYRNQVNYYREQGQTLQEAEENAFADFQAKTEEAQQSSRPDKISKQQASVLGRLILAFQNTPMQYNRIIKKSVLDLVNRRGSDKSNISKIIYYGTAQSLIFSALQNALFALAFDDEKEEEEREEFASKKQNRILDGMIGTLLRGSGLKGAVADTLIKVYRRFASEKEKGWKADYGNVLVDAANISPPIGSKLRKLYSAMKTVKFNQGVMDVMSPLNIDNPLYDASSSAIEAATNIPTQRVYRKITNMKTALTDDIAPWQRIAIALGWSRWDVGLDVDEDITKAREEVKKQKKTAGQRCRAITSSGKRCKNRTENKSGRCFAHE
jgi:hypothetical protein